MPNSEHRELLLAAIQGYKKQRDDIDEEIRRLEHRVNWGGPRGRHSQNGIVVQLDEEPAPQKKRHVISAAGRKRIAAAQRRRWRAKKRAESAA